MTMKVRHLPYAAAVLVAAGLAPAAEAQNEGAVVDAIPVRRPPVQERVEMAATSAWAADFAADSCSLTRTFGAGGSSVTLRLKQFEPQPSIEVTLASETVKLKPRDPRYAFADGEPRDIAFFQTFRLGEGLSGATFEASPPLPHPGGTTQTDLPAARDPAMHAVDTMTVRDLFERDLTLRMGSLQQPLAVMTTCLDDLLTSWGLDAAAHRSLTRRVTEKNPGTENNPGEVWPGKFKHPMPQIARWPADKMDFILLVDESGSVEQCRLVGGLAEDAKLAENICEGMPKGWAFDPALDANGRAIRSYHRATFIKSVRTTVSGVY